MMTYEEFATSIQRFLIEKNLHDATILYITGIIILIVLIVFIIYLRKRFLQEKKEKDDFNPDRLKGNFDYPGFHKGITRDEFPKSKKDDKGDSWGKIDEE